MHKKKISQENKSKKSTKLPWIITGSVALAILVVVGVFFGKSQYDAYHDRPLASNLQYIGHKYSSGCAIAWMHFMCTSPETEYLYYATDTDPKDIISMFQGVKLKDTNTTSYPLWDNDTVSEVNNYNFISTVSNNKGGYSNIVNKPGIISSAHLQSTHRRYIIEIDRDSYDLLRDSLPPTK